MRRKVWIPILIVATLFVMVAPGASAQSPCNGVTHVVQTGENLYRISLQYGLTWDVVAAANGITNPNDIKIAQTLCIPTGGTFGTGGPTTQQPTTATTTGAGSVVVGGRVEVNSGYFVVDRAANSVEVIIPIGTIDPASGFATTATVGLDATNNLLHVQTSGMIPNSYAVMYTAHRLDNLFDARAGVLRANELGVIDGYVEIPFLTHHTHQYVIVRAYDGRQTFGFFDLGDRFP